MAIEKIKKEYFASGVTKRIMTFVDGIQEGPTVEYYESGAVKKKMEYINGQIEGVAREFYESGELWVEEIYKQGQLHGMVRSFYKNGTTQSELPYVGGKLSGECRVYYGSGILKKEGRFRDGKQTGKARIFHETGGIRRKGDFFDEDDARDEVVYEKGTKTEKVSGSKLFIQFVVLMAFIGIVAYMFDPETGFFSGEKKDTLNKELKSMASPSRDPMLPPVNPPDGVVKTYYPTGELYAEWSFLKGKQHGPTKKYYPDGKLQSEIHYKHGIVDGRSVIYHESGRVLANHEYRDGAVVTEKSQESERRGNRIFIPQNNPDYDDSAFD